MKPDIETDADIRRVVDAFYHGITDDELLGPHFRGTNFEQHLPRMYAFWSSVVFQSGTYRGRPFEKHAALEGLRPAHFERWLTRFRRVVDARYAGPRADQMKERAQQIGWIFRSKLCDADDAATTHQL